MTDICVKKAKKVRKRGSGSNFIRAWIIIIAVIALLWTVVLVFLNSALREYESVQPVHMAQAVFEKYFSGLDSGDVPIGADTIKERFALATVIAPTGFEPDDSALDYFAEALEKGEFEWYETVSAGENEKKYAVTSAGVQVAEFTLKRAGQTTKYLKLVGWEKSGIRITLEPLRGVSVYAPLYSVVTVNGVPLTEENEVGERVILENADYFPEDDEDFRVMVNYYVEGLYFTPEVKVASPGMASVEYQTVYDPENEAYDAELGYRQTLADSYNNSVEKIRYYRDLAEKRRIEEEERLRREKEEKERLEREERQRRSDEIKVVYNDFVVEANQQYVRYSHSPKATRTAMRSATLAYFKSGTKHYSAISSYLDYADWYPDTIEFENVNTDEYEWIDENHKQFRCRITMDVVMKGKTYTPEGYKYDTVNEKYDYYVWIDVSGKKNLICDMSLAGA